ncbi:MAG: amidohydrolase family protein [Anaerolineales bacterium]
MKTYIRSKQLIVDPALPPIQQGIVGFENNKIIDVGSASTIAIPPGSQVIDCSEETVMPGLIDTHGHIVTNSKYRMTLKEQQSLDVATAALRGSMNLRSDLAAGVTSLRALGDFGDLELKFREAIEREEIPGPRLVISIRALRPSHGTAFFMAAAADGVDEIRKCIRENFSMGADVVKIFVTNVSNGQTAEDYRRGDLTQVPAYSREELFAAIGQAHDLGMRVAGHAIGGPAMRWAMEAGIDSVEHANMLEEQDIEYFVKYGTYLSDPNLRLFFDEEVGFPSRDNYQLDWWREKVAVARKMTEEYIPKVMQAGTKVCLAVDSGHGHLWREVKYLAQLGASNTEALKAVTTNSAELLGMQDSIGTLEKGKLADIISVHGDPLQDVTALKDVHLVIKDGKRFA